ncbi:hypothetical protein DRO33_03790 [Candidatus Bathyarchaeota archaeon]|nr:MAG: hypothetical protein DRO33_03790 [Candidatus Bathyarchaeota archaeon]
MRASWSRTRDQWRSWTQGEARVWKPGRVEPFAEAKLRDGPLFGAAEARLGAAWEGVGPAVGRVWLWPEGGLWELGAVANSQWLVKKLALSLNGEAFWRWGEEGPPASESLYPAGFGYFLSAAARWRGLSASLYLRGKGLQLERKRLSFSLSVEF